MTSRLKPVRFGLTTAIVWCAYVFCLGVMATYLNWGNTMQSAIRSIYPGYRRTPGGIVIGTVWAFFDGFFGATIFAWLYNLLAGARHRYIRETDRKK
ncbi:MAG: bacteriophage holin [Methanocella sp.]